MHGAKPHAFFCSHLNFCYHLYFYQSTFWQRLHRYSRASRERLSEKLCINRIHVCRLCATRLMCFVVVQPLTDSVPASSPICLKAEKRRSELLSLLFGMLSVACTTSCWFGSIRYLDALPKDFTKEDLVNLRLANNESAVVKTIICRWGKEEKIKKIGPNLWQKCP